MGRDLPAIHGHDHRIHGPDPINGLTSPVLAMRATGVQTGGGNTLAGNFDAFDWTLDSSGGWTQGTPADVLDLSTNQPEVLVSGLVQVTLQVETIATLPAGAAWHPNIAFKSTPFGRPFGTWALDAYQFESRCYAPGGVGGMRHSATSIPWLMFSDRTNNGGGADRLSLSVFYDGGSDLTGSETATATLWVLCWPI